MTRPIRLASLFLAAILAGCSTTQSVRDQLAAEDDDALAALAKVTLRDARGALELAERAGDIRAATCWRELIPVVERLEAYRLAAEAVAAQGSGFLVLYQRARNVRRFIEDPPEALDIACAPMIADSRDRLRSLLRLVGVL